MSPTADIAGRLKSRPSILRRFKERGTAAIEFALTLPVWVALLIGTTDGAFMMLLSQRTDRIAYTVTDLVTQSETVTINDLDTILLAAGELMAPFPFATNGVVIITSLFKPAGQGVEIRWQHTGGGGLARGSKIGIPGVPPQMPGGLTLNDNENVIVAEVYYAYRPLFINAGIFEEGDFYRYSVYKPRLSPLITAPT